MIDPIAAPKPALDFYNESQMLSQFTPLIRKYAWKFHFRSSGMGAPMSRQDMEQELSLVFVKCVRSFDPEHKSTFMNFVISAWYHHVNALLRKDQRNCETAYTIQAESAEADDESTAYSIFDTVDSGWANPEENVEALDTIKVALEGMSPQARMLVEVLMDPPDEVCKQFHLQDLGITSRRQLGTGICRTNKQLDLKFLFRLFNITGQQCRTLRREIDQHVGAAFNFSR